MTESDVLVHEVFHEEQRIIMGETFRRFAGGLSEHVKLCFDELLDQLPQFYLLRSDSKYSAPDIIDGILLTNLNYNNNYSCALYKMDYDTFPSLKRVRHHLRVCEWRE